MRLFFLSIILLLCLSTGVMGAGWTVTVTLSAYPPEIVPSGYGLDCSTYDSPDLDVWISSGEEDFPKLSITVTPHDIPIDVKVTSISISAFMATDFLVSDTLTKTFEVPYNETIYVPDSILPTFNSSFSSSYINSLVK